MLVARDVSIGAIMKKIVIGISGASGMPLAIRLLEELKKQKDIEMHLVYTKSACLTILQECQKAIQDIEDLADVVYNNENIGASIASGTYEVNGMIVIPCSMKTVAGIKSGYTDNLLLRACDVMIKEHRKLVLVTRESPLSVIHLDNLAYLSRIHHVYIVPPMMTYYQKPMTIENMEIHIIGKILKLFDIEIDGFQSWK